MVSQQTIIPLVESLRAEQCRRWRQNEQLPVETYLEQYPILQTEPERALELVYQEVLLREELGEGPQLTEYRQRFPQFASQLQALFEVHRVIASVQVLGASIGGESAICESPSITQPASIKPAPIEPRQEATGFHSSRQNLSMASGSPAIPGYEVVGELGRGGMGVVYLARQIRLNRLVALKMIRAGAHASPEEVIRFRAEAETVARLQHPNIVQIYEVGELDGCPYLALEFVSGGSLVRRLNGAPVPPHQAAELTAKLARATEYAHRQGVIHRDLKPANILLAGGDRHPGVPQVEAANLALVGYEPKITDFGLAKRLDQALAHTQTGSVLGTADYMAPEQAEGKIHAIGPATDVYALGAILYELLTGRPPFQSGALLETLEQVRTLDPVPPRFLQPKLPHDVETICLKCLEKEPGRRYPSAQDLADDLTRFLNGESIHARSISMVEQLTRLVNRNRYAFPRGRFHAGLYFFLAPFPFMSQLLLVLAAGGRPFYPLASLAVLLLTIIVVLGALFAGEWVRPTGLPAKVTRHVWSARLGLVLGLPPLALISYLTTPADRPWNPLPIYAQWIVIAAVSFFHLGSVMWGRMYLLGLGMFAVAALMAWRLDLSPLLMGLALTTVFVVLGLHLRRLSREAEPAANA